MTVFFAAVMAMFAAAVGIVSAKADLNSAVQAE
jgi:hypothetical protein